MSSSRILKVIQETHEKYLNYFRLKVLHRDGTRGDYFMASRSENLEGLKLNAGPESRCDGVLVYALCGEKVVLIRQYRYPLGGFIYEFPAGLVEKGESYQEAGVREFHEETGMTLIPETVDEAYMKPRFTTIGMTDESCAAVFGRAVGTPSRALQEGAEEIEIVLADKSEVRRILKEEQVAVMCAYMLYHFLAAEGDPFDFLHKGGI